MDASDFTVSGTTATVTCSVTTVTSSTVFDIKISGGDLANLNATVTLGVVAGGIQDLTGNALTNTTPTGTNNNTYVVTNTSDMSVVSFRLADVG